jgi:hypothetical protein
MLAMLMLHVSPSEQAGGIGMGFVKNLEGVSTGTLCTAGIRCQQLAPS